MQYEITIALRSIRAYAREPECPANAVFLGGNIDDL
jgi:hypothetical protein